MSTSFDMDEQAVAYHGWCLRIMGSSMEWTHWEITEKPLAVGRGLGCQLRFDDPRVSRLQCEIWLENGQPRGRNRSSSNTSQLNGEPFEDSELALGDVIQFAHYRLIVDYLPVQRMSTPDSAGPKTLRAFEDTPFQRKRIDATASEEGRFTSDLLGLFHLSRLLAQATSVDTVVEKLQEHLAGRLKPENVWLAWPIRGHGEMTLYPAASPGESDRVPTRVLHEAAQGERGVLAVHAGRSIVAAPLSHAGTTIGVLCGVRIQEYQPEDLDYLLAVTECVSPHLLAVERLEQLQRDASHEFMESGDTKLLGSSEIMGKLRRELARVAQSGQHVLLLGETGTGKELAARMIHDLSNRAAGPYVPVNCAAIPAELFDSEMFGYEKGAFSGATQRRKGLFEEAHGGTLFLDEIGDLNMPAQARLLRAADAGLIRRVGAVVELQLDIRIVSATNRPLPDLSNVDFRRDLFHRLAGFVLYLPPLRERREDIPELAEYFLRLCAPSTAARPRSFSPLALDTLMTYEWPGNVRELRNIVERAAYLAKGAVVERIEGLTGNTEVPTVQEGPLPSLEELEQRHLQQVLDAHGDDVAAAARALGMPKSTLYYKLSRHGLSRRRKKNG